MRHLLACLVLACLTTLPAIDVPAPAAMPDAEAYAVLVIPDLRATCTHVEAAAAALGQPLPPGMLAQGVGALLGDPKLAELPAGPIVAVAGPGVPFPTCAVIVPSTKPAAYAAILAQHGMASEALPTSVVFAHSIDGVDLGKRLVPKLAGLLPAAPAADLRLLLATDRLATAYLPFLLQTFSQMSQNQARLLGSTPAAAANGAKVVDLMNSIVPILAKEAGSLQVDLTIGAAGLRIDTIHAPRPGGILCKALVAPRPAVATFANRLGAGDGHLTMVGRYNPALLTAMADLLTPFTTDPKTNAFISPELVAIFREGAVICTGELAMRQGIGGSLASQEGYYSISDAAKAAALAERGAALVTKGPLADLYRDMGITITHQPKARNGPGGVRIDRLSLAFDATKLPPGQGDLLNQMMKPSEFAFAPDALVMSADPTRLDRLLGAGFGPCVLAAEKTLGKGWDGYIDYDIGMQMRNQIKLMPGGAQGPAAMFNRMPTGIPLAISWAIRDGRIRVAVDIPMAFATATRQAFAGDNAAPAPSAAPVF